MRLTAPACAELGAAQLMTADALNCILTGEIIKDQYAARYRPTKYVICGATLAGGELGLPCALRGDGAPRDHYRLPMTERRR